jgi:hypothetical protein
MGTSEQNHGYSQALSSLSVPILLLCFLFVWLVGLIWWDWGLNSGVQGFELTKQALYC